MFEKNKGKILGVGLGLFFGFIYLIAGFWKMIFFAFLVGLGFVIGYQFDHKENVREWIDEIFMDKWMRK